MLTVVLEAMLGLGGFVLLAVSAAASAAGRSSVGPLLGQGEDGAGELLDVRFGPEHRADRQATVTAVATWMT